MSFLRKYYSNYLVSGFYLLSSLCSLALPTPPEVWKDYNPDDGDFREEVVHEAKNGGVFYRDSYISAYINDEEVRVFCKYAVKDGARNAPALLNVHGWMGGPSIDNSYVEDGWAVMSFDYSGITKRRHYTRYPDALRHGHMEAHSMGFSLIYDKMPDGSQLLDPKASSHYLWNAIQRRALSYLLNQKEVDKSRVGAKGYSYGGTLMWNLAMDQRLKAMVAYFGIGWINYYRDRAVWKFNNLLQAPPQSSGQKLFLAALAPQAHAPYIKAASLWLNGSNDHHGGHERSEQTFRAFQPHVPWDFAVQARGHHNTEKLGDNCKVWLEKHVLGKPHFWAARPSSELRLDAQGIPEIQVTPSSPDRIVDLQIYQCLKTANNIARSWRDVTSVRKGSKWVAKLPVLDVNDYVFSYANIRYDNDTVVSSDFEAAIPIKLGNAVATEVKSNTLPEGTGQWSHVAPAEGIGGVKGFRPLNKHRGTSSKQFGDPKWQAPKGAVLSFRFYCTQPQDLRLEANGRFVTDLKITASNEWQSIQFRPDQLKHAQLGSMKGWSEVNQISIKPIKGADITKVVFADFQWVDSQ